MKTTAQNISALLNDGQRWYDAAGIHLDMLAETAGGWATRSPRATDTYRWDFRDGSAIVCAGAGWDFPLAPDPDCFCWEGEGEHQPGCSLAESEPDDGNHKEIMMTRTEAIAKYDSKWWEALAPTEAARIQFHEPRLIMPFGLFHEYFEQLLGRPVWTSEFANRDRLARELAQIDSGPRKGIGAEGVR